MIGIGARRRGILISLFAVLLAGTAAAADPSDADWPCQQRKVPSISAGQVWTGPSLEDVGRSWQDDPVVAGLAHEIAARRTELDEAKRLIADLASSSGSEKNRKLTALAAGMLAIINGDRGSIIAGIERYAKRQKALAAKIEQETAELEQLPADEAGSGNTQRADLREILDWDSRIFQEREQSLTYVCELPVQLERRAFVLGREIQSHLDP